MPPQIWLTLPVALVLGAVHVFGGRLRFLHDVPRSAWLSAAGGVSVAYVFIHLLPELHESQRAFDETLRNGFTGSLERHSYLIALFGLGLFYGLEQLAKSSKRRGKAAAEPATSPGVFWIHLAAFAVYNALIGYLLLHREEKDLRGLAIYAFAMILHFIVNDHGLSADHGAAYDRYGRWILAAAALLGWVLGAAIEVPRLLVPTLFAFLAGGVVLNVLKEELPEERQSRFSAFAAGAAGYAALLLAT
jgi:zinc transporter ZupT